MNSESLYKVFMAMNTAALIAGPVILCLFLGFWLDGLLDTNPFITLIGGVLGFIGSVMSLFRIMKSTK